MNTQKPMKINTLLQETPRGVVLLASWLYQNGYSRDLQKRYKKSLWLQSIGTGASIRYGDDVDFFGALYALQHQAGLDVHVGGRTALSLQGRGHYIDMGKPRVVLFAGAKTTLPSWFRNRDWGNKINCFNTSFLPTDIETDRGFVDLPVKDFTVKISAPARAMLECLYLTPQHQEMYECYELMESLNNLHPKQVQKLLENCSSVKAKRLFLYFADKWQHQWFKALDLSNVDLGKGNRSLSKGGVYIPKYKIVVPKEFERNEQSDL